MTHGVIQPLMKPAEFLIIHTPGITFSFINFRECFLYYDNRETISWKQFKWISRTDTDMWKLWFHVVISQGQIVEIWIRKSGKDRGKSELSH